MQCSNSQMNSTVDGPRPRPGLPPRLSLTRQTVLSQLPILAKYINIPTYTYAYLHIRTRYCQDTCIY